MVEIWKPIIGYEERYAISSFGRIKSLSRTSIASNGISYSIKGRIMKPIKNKFGYYRIGLYKNGKKKSVFIHSLVAETFIRRKGEYQTEVNHIDGNKANNNVSNLEWCTRQENMQHAYKHNLVAFKKPAHPSKRIAKLDNNDKIICIYNSIIETSRDTGIDANSISHVVRGKYKRTGGYGWQYVK